MINKQGNLLGHREDAIAIPIDDEIMVINIDGWVESTDRPQGMSAYQVGYRAVANAISDVIVKGATPEGMIISSAISSKHKSELRDIIRGFNQASQDFSTPYFGGDMNSSNDLVIDVTVWGRTDKLVRRDGAQIGDNVYWLGPDLGCTAVALGILTQQWTGDREKALDVMGHPPLYPEFVDIPAHAATDSSDGIAKGLYHISTASKVSIEIQNLPSPAKWIGQAAENNGLRLSDLYFYGGEELGVIFTCDPSIELPDHVIFLGEVMEGEGVWHKTSQLENRGWDHLLNLQS